MSTVAKTQGVGSASFRRVAAAAVAVCSLVLAGCGADDDPAAGAGTDTAPTAAPVTPSVSPSTSTGTPTGTPAPDVTSSEPSVVTGDADATHSDSPADSTSEPVATDQPGTPALDETPPSEPGEPLPVDPEPTGGADDGGAGAEPLPEADAPPPEGDWHGAEVPTTNCPGITFVPVEGVGFAFSVPDDFEDQQVQGIDSQVGQYLADGFELFYDFGWYSGPLDESPGMVELVRLNYSGATGHKVLIDGPAAGFIGQVLGVHLVLTGVGEFDDLLTMTIRFDNPEDRFIAECIVGSIRWT